MRMVVMVQRQKEMRADLEDSRCVCMCRKVSRACLFGIFGAACDIFHHALLKKSGSSGVGVAFLASLNRFVFILGALAHFGGLDHANRRSAFDIIKWERSCDMENHVHQRGFESHFNTKNQAANKNTPLKVCYENERVSLCFSQQPKRPTLTHITPLSLSQCNLAQSNGSAF